MNKKTRLHATKEIDALACVVACGVFNTYKTFSSSVDILVACLDPIRSSVGSRRSFLHITDERDSLHVL